ncbi:MAG: MarR family transcriptional regulator [Muribaculaceae bacterium]|nr:MarR family transcriptional regulator [Muribaculaceae bacterium]
MKRAVEPMEVDIKTLGYYIDRSLCVMIKRLNKELREENLKFQHSDFSVMKVLNEVDSINQSHLAKLLGKEKSGIGKTLKSLEKEGYIQRNALNGCTNTVKLTEKGKEVIPVINRIADKVTERAFSGFSAKKRADVMKSLTLIYKNSL